MIEVLLVPACPQETSTRRRTSPASCTQGGEGDEREVKACAHCKPLMPWMGPSSCSHHYILPAGTRVLYGNESM